MADEAKEETAPGAARGAVWGRAGALSLAAVLAAVGPAAGACGGEETTGAASTWGDSGPSATATSGGPGGGGQGGGHQGGGGAGGSTGSGEGGGGAGSGQGGTGSGQGGTGGTGGTAVGAGGAPPDPTCEEYCDVIMANCQNANTQYKDVETCLAVCGAFPLGTGSDTSGNTLGCRLYHAKAAFDDPPLHCTHAGPGGAGMCGANCEGFCAVMKHVCKGQSDPYPTDADCLAECEGFPDEIPYSVYESMGDTLACRLYFATLASFDPVVHCSNAVESSIPCQ